MSVIADLRLDATAFELGRILDVGPGATVELDRMIPLGDRAVPCVWLYHGSPERFEARVGAHDAVDDVRIARHDDDCTLFAVDWRADRDRVLRGVRDTGGQLLSATGTGAEWKLELRFSHHRELSAFREQCTEAGVSLDVARVYSPTKDGPGPSHGLSRPQREALVTAVDRGYYEIPRRISTQELADELGISDQATTERLRRGIDELVQNALVETERRRPPERAERG